VSGVPHSGQNVRTTCAEDLNSFGRPLVKRKPLPGNVTQATTGAAATLRQDWQ
jgi:hypothetical protein